MFLYLPKLLCPYYSLLLFSLSLLSVYRLVLWGWGLRNDRVYITLSQPCTAYIFFNNNNNNNNNVLLHGSNPGAFWMSYRRGVLFTRSSHTAVRDLHRRVMPGSCDV